jgi:hypothetical protein
MGIVVQTGSGNLSTMTWYQAVSTANAFPVNTGNENIGWFDARTARHINFTPTAAGNLKGVILALRHDGINLDQWTYTVKLQENTGTWVDRLTKTLSYSDLVITTPTVSTIFGCVDFRFASTYAITTAASTWRFEISATSTQSRDCGVMASQNSNEDYIFFIPYIDTTTSLGTNAVVLTDKLTIDQNQIFGRHDAQSGTQGGIDAWKRFYSVYCCTPIQTSGSETYPGMYVPPTITSNKSLEFEGGYYISSYCTDAFKAGDSWTSMIPSAYKLTIEFSNQDSTHKGGFWSNYTGGLYGFYCQVKLYGYEPTIVAYLSDPVSATDTAVIVKGDVTSDWVAGDKIMITGGGSSTAPNRDFAKSEYREILSVSYSAVNDETTVNLTSAVTYDHELHTRIEVPVVKTNRNITVSFDAFPYTSSAGRHRITHGGFKCQGVEFVNGDKIESYITTAAWFSASQLSEIKTEYKSCNVHNTYSGYSSEECEADYSMEDCTSSNSHTSATASAVASCARVLYNKGTVSITECFFLRGTVGLILGQAVNVFIDSCFFESSIGVRFSLNSSSVEMINCIGYNCTKGIENRGSANIYLGLNTWVKIYYALTSTSGAVIFNYTTEPAINWIVEDDIFDGAYILNYVASGYYDVLFDNIQTFNIGAGGIVYEGNRDNWVASTSIRFQNLEGLSGHCKEWNAEGFMESTGTGLPDTEAHTTGSGYLAWRIAPYYIDAAYVKEFTIPVPLSVTGFAVSVGLWIKLKSGYSSGTHDAPRLTVSGAGATAVSVSANTGDTSWQFIFVTAVPTTLGYMRAIVRIKTDAANPNNEVHFDDFIVSYKEPIALGGLDVPVKGIYPRIPINMLSTPAQVWAELLANNTLVGSFGAFIQTLALAATLGVPVSLDGGSVDISGMLKKLADDNGGASYDATTDSQRALASAVASVPTAAIVKAQADQALTDYDGPTKAELDAAEAAIRGVDNDDLKGISDQIDGVPTAAIIKAQADQALTDYDSPTKAELDTVESNIRGADGDDLKSISDQIDSIPAGVDTQLSTSHGSGSWEGSTEIDIANAVDTLLSTNHGSGSWEGLSATETADAVWNALISSYSAVGTFGLIVQDIHLAAFITKALVHDNAYLDTMSFDDNKNLTGARLRCYDSKANSEAAKAGGPGTVGLLYTFTISATYDVDNEQTDFMIVRE